MTRNIELRQEDRAQLGAAGIAVEEAERQLALLRNPPETLRLERPCTVTDGITRLEPKDHDRLVQRWQAAADSGRLTKFVPASGAASRMFSDLSALLTREGRLHPDSLESEGATDEAATLRQLTTNLPKLPFRHSIPQHLASESADDLRPLLEFLLTDRGLALPSRPKALLPFHAGAGGIHAAFEDQLIEGRAYASDADGTARFHFTVGVEHLPSFKHAAQGRHIEGGVDDIGFSVQRPSTATLACDETGQPFRSTDGTLLLRPGGHGALIENLAALGGDIAVIKNIDNVLPQAAQQEVIHWKRLLIGLLLELEGEIAAIQQALIEKPSDQSVVSQAETFLRGRLSQVDAAGEPDGRLPDRAQRSLTRLDRPLRVCGMVVNQEEPGGGPFWVRHPDGTRSIQIVESAQVDRGDPEQRAAWASSTHFNPVDLVCSLRNPSGEPYSLTEFVDPLAVFISDRTYHGRPLRALEHPGLWNGAMAYWNSVFVEVPAATFAPVKTLFDLLRPEHQPAQ